ncbi:unnamed protein product [Toxocara canis]|uniref:G_PROTEIN_RECEP_F1_2 domain-containing protein n=1 Tax=Toxocara canis TaxID=6265 RepID=A0A183V1V2_TOXCA|nr:unnamed protein product [Toxocara canis]
MSYSLVAICSLLGNVSVLLVVVLRSEMQTVTNLFIGSVSAADILITAVSLWSTPLSFYQTVWKFGPFMCYAVYAVQGASLMWSPLALAAIAVDRYLLVSFPFKKQIDNRTCLLIICGIWLGALLILAPMLVHVHYFDVSECYQYCVEIWPDERVLRFLYGLTVLTIRSAIPLATIAFCHWRIACVLNEQTTRLQTMRSMSTQVLLDVITNKSLRHAVDIRKKQRLQKLLLMMVIIFGVSSFPLDLFNVVQDLELAYRTQLFPQQFKQVAFLITHWFAMAGTLCNPLVYAWWNDNFRKETQVTILCSLVLLFH